MSLRPSFPYTNMYNFYFDNSIVTIRESDFES